MKVTLPALPNPDANGHVSAIEYTRVSLARSLIRERTALGLSHRNRLPRSFAFDGLTK